MIVLCACVAYRLCSESAIVNSFDFMCILALQHIFLANISKPFSNILVQFHWDAGRNEHYFRGVFFSYYLIVLQHQLSFMIQILKSRVHDVGILTNHSFMRPFQVFPFA